MKVLTKVALVANKVTLKAAERSTNAKLSELEEKGCKVKSITSSAFPVPDDENPNQLRLLWLSVITYEIDEKSWNPQTISANPSYAKKAPIIVYEENE